ncbi:hypothetical protein H5410_015205 [Solanum commersonii]|uniref:Uncharacterized protein n=1 Tax=Solanum commersonii TaxID=4109 RepID=A0A9J5ZSX5_SOLCO|nr:hypothetical protein H5410_015205 [Solanum commersonii]
MTSDVACQHHPWPTHIGLPTSDMSCQCHPSPTHTDLPMLDVAWPQHPWRAHIGRRDYFVELHHEIKSSKWAIFGKLNWQCEMNRKPAYSAKLYSNQDPTKGVSRLRQQKGGHGSRNLLRSVYQFTIRVN